jgi:hypothetical protein
VKRAFVITLATLGLIVVGGIGLFFYGMAGIAETVKVTEIFSGRTGPYSIGATKRELVDGMASEAYSPEPKPPECPVTWIYVPVTENQRGCLMNVDKWNVASYGRELCPERTDWHASLHFKHEVLAKVVVRCTEPI